MESPFREIAIDRMTEGPTTIYWDLVESFRDPGPYRFRIQHGRTGSPNADDWTDVGPEVVDTFMAVDNTKREIARAITSHYRIILNTGIGRYISAPSSSFQYLNRFQWRMAREMLRRNRKSLLRNPYSRDGYLLIRRRYGPDCPRCLDPKTKEVRDPDCPSCYGVGKLGGYFKALPYQNAFISPRHLTEKVVPGEATRADDLRNGTFLGYPLLHTYDVFVDAHTDERFVVQNILQVETMRAVPIIQTGEVTALDFSNAVYRFPLTQ